MADTHEETINALRNEMNSVRAQLEALVKTLGEKKGEITATLEDKVLSELEHYRKLAKENMGTAYEAGSESLEELSERVRRSPLTSLGLAFGAGYLLSCIFRR